jgi:hypothetical protein
MPCGAVGGCATSRAVTARKSIILCALIRILL